MWNYVEPQDVSYSLHLIRPIYTRIEPIWCHPVQDIVLLQNGINSQARMHLYSAEEYQQVNVSTSSCSSTLPLEHKPIEIQGRRTRETTVPSHDVVSLLVNAQVRFCSCVARCNTTFEMANRQDRELVKNSSRRVN